MIIKKFILTILILIAIISIPASATITITPTDITSSSIMWTWGPETIQNLSIDGIYVCRFNPTATSFILSDLGPNEPHTITIITAGDSGTNTTYTLPDSNIESSTDFMGLLNTWWYLILIMILCIVGMMRKLGIFLLMASAVSVYALVVFVQSSSITGTDPLIQIPLYIYLIFFVIPLWLCFGVKGGVFK